MGLIIEQGGAFDEYEAVALPPATPKRCIMTPPCAPGGMGGIGAPGAPGGMGGSEPICWPGSLIAVFLCGFKE